MICLGIQGEYNVYNMNNYDFKPVWNYNQICTIIKRYSFETKMKELFINSLNHIDYRFSREGNFGEIAFPWEIETLMILSVRMPEWKSQTFNSKDFAKCIEGIRNYHHPKLDFGNPNLFTKWFMILTSATQFDIQTNPIFRVGRYYEYFTFKNNTIDMEREYVDRFGMTYGEMIAPLFWMWLQYLNRKEIGIRINELRELYDNHNEAFSLFTISRENYINELDSITEDYNDYVYCLRPSYVYPFIEEKGVIYNPTPHLIVKSITTSLMFRLTEGNGILRGKIGKNVFEYYLIKILNECALFSEVIPEQQYGNGQKTIDVMTSINETIVCFDSKSFTPKIALRSFSEESYEADADRIVEGIVQAYKHTYLKLGNDYNYLSTEIEKSRDNVFGVVVLEENAYISLEDLYQKSAQKLGIVADSVEYNWLRGHIGVVDIDILELQLFWRDNFIEALYKNIKTKRYGDNWFMSGPTKKRNNTPYFIKENCRRILDLIQ